VPLIAWENRHRVTVGDEKSLFVPRYSSKSNIFPARIQANSHGLVEVERRVAADGFALPRTVAWPFGPLRTGNKPNLHSAFLTRMIFSCKIDEKPAAAAAFDSRGGLRTA
jgi:hypothetical protein